MLRWESMMRLLGHTKTLSLGAALIAVAGFAVACGAMDATSSLDGDTQVPGSGSSGADSGARDPSLKPTPDNGPVDNAVILVHAAKAQSFRLCFENELERRPQPDSQVMPDANV